MNIIDYNKTTANLIELVNTQWEKHDISIDNFDKNKGKCSLDLSNRNRYRELQLVYDFGNDAVIIKYKELNEIVNNIELKVNVDHKHVKAIRPEILIVLKLFANTDTIDQLYNAPYKSSIQWFQKLKRIVASGGIALDKDFNVTSNNKIIHFGKNTRTLRFD